MLRACITCGALSKESRCPEHRQARKRNGSTYAWRKVREEVIARDGGVCTYCGDNESNEVDHVIPVEDGGSDDKDNLVCACGWCNRSKRAGSAPGRKPTRLRVGGGR